MYHTDKVNIEKYHFSYYQIFIKQAPFVLFFLLSAQIYAQQETRTGSFSVHAGVNSGILSGGFGPSFSFHYAPETGKVLQLESMLFFDSHSGKTFLTGESQRNLGLGLAAGARINIFPNRNWNPSFLIMPGLIYSSETTSRYDDHGRSGVSGTVCLAFSNAFYNKHMVSIGLDAGSNIFAAYLKYGFWF